MFSIRAHVSALLRGQGGVYGCVVKTARALDGNIFEVSKTNTLQDKR